MQEKLDINLAKGLTILLVVIGHTLAGGVSVGNEWFSEVVHRIYLFHMPFFMFLSGFLYFRPGRAEKISFAPWEHAGKQAVRLLLPFFSLGLIVIAGKMLMQHFVHVDNVPGGLTDGLIKLFWLTDKSPSMFVWYILVLFCYTSIITPLLYPLFKDNFGYWIGFALTLYFLPAVHYMYLDRVAQYFIFFVIGGAVRYQEDIYTQAIDKDKLLWFLAAGFLALLYFVPYRPVLVSPLGLLVAGVMSIPLLHALSRKILFANNVLTKTFLTLGAYSYVIYLANVIVIGVVKGVMFKVTTWDHGHFWYFIPILILAGIIAPIVGEFIVLQHIPFVRKYILGKAEKTSLKTFVQAGA